MKRIAPWVVVAVLFAIVATPALASEPTTRDIQAAVDSYLGTAASDATLVGGPGSAGYDAGFWIRGGDFLLRINLTLQTRFEWFDYDKSEEGRLVQVPANHPVFGNADAIDVPWPGGDLSGFSLPRGTLKLSGEALCNTRYYAELEFGDPGSPLLSLIHSVAQPNFGPFLKDTWNYDILREAWLEWGFNSALNVRMGKVKTPSTRQMMVPPELQQFGDVSMASALTGALQPGYTDRNRDYGLLLHGLLGCRNEWQYMVAITNGDGGDGLRNVLNPLTSDNLGYSARVNWAFLRPIGYTEGALRQETCAWYGELGVWGSYYADRVDGGRSGLWPHTAQYDRLLAGFDIAMGFGGFSFSGAFTYALLEASDLPAHFQDEEWMLVLVQAGYHFPGTGWEIAARWSSYGRTIGMPGGDLEPETNNLAVVLNYYLNGHANKLTLSGTFISARSDGLAGGGYFDAYSGVPLGYNSESDSVLMRVQWQLAL